ncbi:hypothetical protein G7Z17_g343 [Cylindrodendrum hubeiense]|uniref:chitinase n=1 Tax=Cylindrodendrum hubeiense TaxID=595255 RepID=A0A9P5LGF2_9HYPO|nr:hypothetical protein G7Z17_g343 [Cylindrodendrum hubeiense]
MDGISSEMYKNIGNIKSRNPDLKILIALGGWTFSDPGTWQSVFPDVVSSQVNRDTFIQNLLGFLSEYGYDGVDFDWEYPGADDRGGSDVDAANYVALLQELQAAIELSGKSYIVTFTAPTSYWYLRHFDLKNMEKYVNWINLMSYDLHGVWDGDNPIGSQVLAHSNLTEIDIALDLVEITDILANTGATSYLDKDAAARYLVYDDDSWISFDDVDTIKSKVDYANKMGLSGLMVWAIDLDDNGLTALRAVSGREYTGGSQTPFTLVDIEKLFPTEMLPAEDDALNYGLINFGGSANSGQMDPSNTAFGFILITGEPFAVTQLRKRDDQPDPFVFIDCPENVTDRPKNETQKARVVCLSEDVKGCFRLLERGVKGTIVEMPDNCAPNTFARAISLETSADQEVPDELEKLAHTSQILEFSFDFDMNLARRDTDKSNIRIDYSNAQGYWDAVVDAPGIQSRDLGTLNERYFAPLNQDWRELFQESDKYEWRSQDAEKIQEDISAPLFWETVEDCPIDGEEYGEGVGGFVTGTVDAEFYYGFSLVASLTSDSFDVKQANGFLKVKGESDLTFGIGGIGEMDIAKAKKGNPMTVGGTGFTLAGPSVDVNGVAAWVDFTPFFKVDYQIATFNGADRDDFIDSAAPLNGHLKTRVISDFGDFESVFPEPDQEDGLLAEDKRDKNEIDISDDNILYGSTEDGGKITLGTYLTFGLSLSLNFLDDADSGKTKTIDLPEMSIVHNTMAQFKFFSDSGPCTSYDISTHIFQTVENSDSVGWENHGLANLAYDMRAGKRLAGWDWPSGGSAKLEDALGYEADIYVNKRLKADCSEQPSCATCFDGETPGNCCGCVSMDELHGYGDIEACETCDGDDGTWPGTGVASRRDISKELAIDANPDTSYHELHQRESGSATISVKYVSICTTRFWVREPYRYPAFPADPTWPWENINSNKWEDISRYWGNASADCSNWDVTDLTTADTVNLASGTTVRAKYQTEHVFEGQMFSGKQPTSEIKYKSMSNDEQLQSVKELGMTFSYLNNKDVWKAFCATYEAIYEHFGDFDAWYTTNRNGDTDISLQPEWNKYVRAVLDSLVSRSRASFDMMEGYKK